MTQSVKTGGGFINPRSAILDIRRSYLKKDTKAFQGNTNARRNYLTSLESIKPELTTFQKEYVVGLNLGDTSCELDDIKRTARIKLQQSVKHVSLGSYGPKARLDGGGSRGFTRVYA